MKIAITGSTGLAKAIAGALQDHEVIHCRIERELPFDVDVFINNAHIGYNQIDILHHLYKEWWAKDSKYIINISSRAHQPNISKGYFYASQAFVEYKTIDIMLHKDAVPKNIKKKLGIN